KGLDILFGGSGSDLFVLGAGQGRDTIKDFETSRGDQFLLTGGLTFDDLNIRESAAGDTIIRASGNGVLAIVENTPSSSIGADKFTTIVDEFSI
ncbi:MAG: calcium-binding protein, partial [Cyanobacteria bacterium J06592_8]